MVTVLARLVDESIELPKRASVPPQPGLLRCLWLSCFFREYFRLYLDAKKSDAVVFVHRITTRKKVDAKMRAKIAFECESH